MPSLGDISRFLGGQTFGKTSVPDVDLKGKTIIVTGSNTGLGFECAKHLWVILSMNMSMADLF